MTKAKIKRIVGLLTNALCFAFLVVCLLAAALLLSARRDAYGAAEVFGYRLFVVVSDSMEECELTDVKDFQIGSIPLRSMVLVESIPEDEAAAEEFYSSLKVGDVLTFRYVYDTQVTITHRLISVQKKPEGGYLLQLAGDNKNADTDILYQTIDTSKKHSGNYVIGRVRGQCYPLGFFVSLLESKAGIVFIVIIPCAIILLLEVLKLAGLRTAAKQAKAEAELSALRRRLSELESQKNGERSENDAND